jgi:phosphatidylcholine synthase
MTGRRRVALAWGVHLYTALGLACAAGIAVLIVEGGDEAFPAAFWLMAVAMLIDATDGTLARAIHIKEVLPGFDGRRLDDLIDFLTYTFLPLLLIWRAKLLPEGCDAVLLLPLFASAYGFCQVEAKTADGFFLGFPSYWNLVALYLYLLRPWPGWLSVGMVVALAVLTFVPTRYLYPSQRGRLNLWTNLLAVPWAALLAASLWLVAADAGAARRVALVSLYYPIWYLVISWAISVRHLLHSRVIEPPRAVPRHHGDGAPAGGEARKGGRASRNFPPPSATS